MNRRLPPVAIALALLAGACGDDSTDTDDRAGASEVPSGETERDGADTAPDTAAPRDSTDGPSSTPATAASPADAASITLVAYDSFPESGTSLNDALDAFTDETGIEVELLIAGDAGTMLSKAVLTAGNPEGDVVWGIDNTFLSRAIAEDVFEPHAVDGVQIDDRYTDLVPNDEATPVDYGDVCVNYDIAWFAEAGLDVPASLDDLTDPAYADLLVVQNPATSSPGLAFLLATIDEYGPDGWTDYWQALADNGVAVTDGWTEAYYGQFTWAGGGDRPLVISYGSSPPAEVIFADPPRDDAPTGVIESTCFRQVEFAGVLRGTPHPEAAKMLVDHLVGERFQSELALNLFVYPTNEAVDLPPEFLEYAVVPDEPRSVDPAEIDENRETWIDEWTAIVLG
jgi:thiamine transport system substrate-binding protein